MIDRASGRSRCFGFITMQDSEVLDTILSQNQILDGKKVDCKRAVPREQGHAQVTSAVPEFKTKKMFVGGLPPDVNDEVFRNYFEQFGEVDDSVVILDKETSRPRGFGFITFKNEDTADKVLENYEKNIINGKWVECKKATPKQVQSIFPSFATPYSMYSNYNQPYTYGYYPRQDYYPQTYSTQLYANSQAYGYQLYNEPNNDNLYDADYSK